LNLGIEQGVGVNQNGFGRRRAPQAILEDLAVTHVGKDRCRAVRAKPHMVDVPARGQSAQSRHRRSLRRADEWLGRDAVSTHRRGL